MVERENEPWRETLEEMNSAIDESGIAEEVIAEKVGISEEEFRNIRKGMHRIGYDTFLAVAVVLHMETEKIRSIRGRMAT